MKINFLVLLLLVISFNYSCIFTIISSTKKEAEEIYSIEGGAIPPHFYAEPSTLLVNEMERKGDQENI
jgi:hypothetical protein